MRRALPWRLLAWGALGVSLHIGLARFGYGVVLPTLRSEMALGYTAGGVLNAVHLGGYLAGTLSGAALARRVGMAGLGRLGHGLAAAGALVCALVPTDPATGPWLLGAGRLAAGFGGGWAVIAILVTVLGGIAVAAREQASVLLWAGLAVAVLGCGLAAPWLLEPALWRLVFVAAAVVAVVLAVGFPAAREVAPAAAGEPGFTLAAVATSRWAWLVATYFCFGLGYIAYATFAGARLAAAGETVAVVTLTWSTAGLATLAGSLLTLAVLARPRLRPLALPGAMALAAVGAAVASLPGLVAALGGAVLVGLGLAATPALITAAARTRSSAGDYASAFSVATAVLGLGQLLGPVLAGALADALGAVAAPLFGAAAYAAGAAVALADLRAGRRPR
ncbi:MAG: YbfB/YjiJ family MFS transporter [Acetobacteraceae bacterium]|nr:YbfB/YjiJ family MFS transporter [Acetobacteraceae bacterium]